MEFHGTWSAPISMTRAVPWNSMELQVRQLRLHEQFHGIPWNLECDNFADASRSMEFHGTSSAPISLTRAVPWNSMELQVHQFRWHKQFHGIECVNFDDTSSFMEFHGTRSAPISMIPAVLWNSMELGVCQFRSYEQFHGIPWNSMELELCQFRWDAPWSVPISLTRAVPWNSMDFHGTRSAPISLTRAVPWNSMELQVRQFRWHKQFHGFPLNSMELGARQFRYTYNYTNPRSWQYRWLANALELLQSCPKPSICYELNSGWHIGGAMCTSHSLMSQLDRCSSHPRPPTPSHIHRWHNWTDVKSWVCCYIPQTTIQCDAVITRSIFSQILTKATP